MASQFQRWLSGFSTFRSYNLGVLCNDEDIKETYVEAGRQGKLPFNRSKVMFLGDARVGKTSLRRALTGERFQKNEASTEGIETRMYESREVDNAWHMSQKVSHTDFEFASAWYTALNSSLKGESNRGNKQIDRDFNRPSLRKTAAKCFKDAIYIFRLYLFTQLFCIIPLCDIFRYGFAPFEWFLFLGLSIAGLDFLTEAYRLGSNVALLFLIENYIRCHLTLDAVSTFFEKLVSSNTLLLYLSFSVVFLAVGFVLGVAIGCGFRTGLAFGLCLLHPPASSTSIDHAIWSDFTEIFSTYLGTALICVSHAVGLILVRFWIFMLGRLPFRIITDLTFVMSTLFATCIILSMAFPEPNNILSFLGSLLLFFGKTIGEFAGREIDARVNIEYLTYKGFGTLIGVTLGHLMGWTFRLSSIFCRTFPVFLMSILTHPLAEIYGFWKVRSQTFPVIYVRDAFRAQKGGLNNLPTKLSLWDFAGDELYHSTHHVFLASHAVYLLVFNLEEAVKNKNKQVDRILFWLNSISIHAKDKDSVIFLVGTHRDSVGLSDQEDIDEYLFENLYDNFCDRLVVNSDRRLAFMVENSAANDAEIFRIKEEVSSKILEAEYMTREFPIRYLKFYKLILTKRNENGNRHLSKSISSHTDVRGYVLRECGISNNEELRDLLCVFHRAGEIIYQPDDPVLKQYVVFDPQILVDIMKTLVTIPPRHKRSHKVASCWHKLEKHGILHSSLIEHIAKQFNLPMHVIISLLTAYDVICPILQRSTRTADELYIVPCLLPPFSSMLNGSLGIRMDDWWMSSEGEEVYYFDFGYLRPDALFSRLHARCLNSDQIRDNSSTRQFFFDVGKFTFGSDVFFKLELLHHLPEQNLIKVNVQRATGTNSRMCVSSLLGHVEVIRRRDFKYLEYSFGFLCPVRHHRNPILQGKLHVVKLANQCCHLREAGPFNFLCEGQNHSVDVFRNNNGSDVWNRETAVDMLHPDRKIAEMPPTLHKQICNNLNVESMIAGDWRALAGEIGCSIEDVRLFSISKNPCDEVLHYWSTKYPVTIKELLEVLQRPSISRRDLVLLIKNHTVSQQ